MTEKKIVRWGTGWVVFITTEAKKIGWNHKTRVAVSTITDENGEKKIEISKAEQ